MRGVPASGIRALANAAWGRPGTVHLELGEPDFNAPPHVIEAASRAARNGEARYGPSPGLPGLRGAIVAKLERDNDLHVQRENVVVAAGGVGVLHAAYNSVLDVGDELLVPDPGWPTFVTLAHTVAATPVRYPLTPDHQPDLDALDRLCSPRTRAIVVNSPSNPLGATWSEETQVRLGDWARRRGLWVIADECYDQMWFDKPVTTFQCAAPDTDVITVFSTSKTYAMTGWRVGYGVAPKGMAAAMIRVQEAVASCVNTVAQHAATAALAGPQDAVLVMRDAYRRRRDNALALAAELGLRVHRPDGAIFLWTRLPESAAEDGAFALDLLESRGVAVAPGSAFGPSGAGHVRMSLAASDSDIRHGLEALAAHLRPAAA
jgi:aspartate aminotransferase